MNKAERLSFELYVMDIVANERCANAKDYERVSQELHDAVESAIQDMCLDNGIEDYIPNIDRQKGGKNE